MSKVPGNCDGLSIGILPEWFLSTVFDCDCNFCSTIKNKNLGAHYGRVGLKHTYVSPDLMNDLIPVPRPVEVALPPRAIVIADRAALFPPW